MRWSGRYLGQVVSGLARPVDLDHLLVVRRTKVVGTASTHLVLGCIGRDLRCWVVEAIEPSKEA